MLTMAMNTASTETVPTRWREKVRPAEILLGTSQLASTEFAAADVSRGKSICLSERRLGEHQGVSSTQ